MIFNQYRKLYQESRIFFWLALITAALLIILKPVHGQTNIIVTPGAVTAIVDFDAPAAGEDCTIDSTFQESSPGVGDFSASKVLPFTNRSLWPTLSVAPKGSVHRTIVLGEWPNVRRGSDGVTRENMAYPAATKIYNRITCGVRSAVLFEFQTKVYPQGFSWHPRQTVDPINPGSYLTGSPHWDVPNFVSVNNFGNVEERFQNPLEISPGGGYTPNTRSGITAGNPVPAGGGAWTAPTGSLGSVDGSYSVYDGTSQEKLFIPLAADANYDTVNCCALDYQTLTIAGCSGTGSTAVLNACRTDDSTTCAGPPKTFTLPAGSFSSCSTTTPTPPTQPNTSPLYYDLWQYDQKAISYSPGFLVWASTNSPTRILLDSASTGFGRSGGLGHAQGGYMHYYSTDTVSVLGKPKYLQIIDGNGPEPTLYYYDPATKHMDFGGIIEQAHPYDPSAVPPVNETFKLGSNGTQWSYLQPNSIYVAFGTGELGQVYIDTASVSSLPWPANASAPIVRKKLINMQNSLHNFFIAHQDVYGNLNDLSQICGYYMTQVNWQPAKGSIPALEYVTIGCQMTGQDTWAWFFVIQVEPGKSDTESAYTKVVAMWPMVQAKNSMYVGMHSVFVNRGKSTVVIGATPTYKEGFGGSGVEATPRRMTVVTQMNPGDTTLVVQSPCGATSNWMPCKTDHPEFWISDIRQGNMLYYDSGGGDGECVYVNSASFSNTTHNWTLNVSRDWCVRNEGGAYGQKTWTVGQTAFMMMSYVGRPANLPQGYEIPQAWDFLRDPTGQNNMLFANYEIGNTHDYCVDEYIGVANGTVFEGGPGTSACESDQGKGLNIGIETKAARWAGGRQPGDGNGAETHPSHAHDKAVGVDRRYEIDSYGFIGGSGSISFFHQDTAGGTQSHLYKLDSLGDLTGSDGIVYHLVPAYKANGLLVIAGNLLLRDISSPATGNIISDATPYTYCYAYRTNECRTGSTRGELWVSAPGVTQTSCQGSEFAAGSGDICAMNVTGYFDVALQNGFIRQGLGNAGTLGDAPYTPNGHSGVDHSRPITRMDFPYRSFSALINMRTTPDGGALMYQSVKGIGGRYMGTITRMPPFGIWDGKRRDEPINFDVKVDVPASLTAANNVVVEFGYDPHLRCVGQQADTVWDGRDEACAKGTQTIQWYDFSAHRMSGSDFGKNFDFAGDEATMTGVSCTAGQSCTVTLPVIPLRTLYYRYKVRDASNNVLMTSHPCTSAQDCMVAIPY